LSILIATTIYLVGIVQNKTIRAERKNKRWSNRWC